MKYPIDKEDKKLVHSIDNKVSAVERQGLRRHRAESWRIADAVLDSRLFRIMKKVRKQYGMSEGTRMVIYRSDQMNMSYSVKSDSFLISEKYLETSSDEELEVFLAHEVAHQRQRPISKLFNAVALASSIAIAALLTNTVRKLSKKGFDYVKDHSESRVQKLAEKLSHWASSSSLYAFSIFSLVSSAVVSKCMVYSHYAFSRFKEYDADKQAIGSTRKPEAFESRLTKSEEYYRERRKESLEPVAPTDPDKKAWELKTKASPVNRSTPSLLDRLGKTHPDSTERIKRAYRSADSFVQRGGG